MSCEALVMSGKKARSISARVRGRVCRSSCAETGLRLRALHDGRATALFFYRLRPMRVAARNATAAPIKTIRAPPTTRV